MSGSEYRLTRRGAVKLFSTAAAASTLPACGIAPDEISSGNAGANGGGGAASLSGKRTGAAGLTDPLYNSSVTALADVVRRGELSAEELVDTYLGRIEAVNPALNAVVQLRAEEARAADEARGGQDLPPLHGVPMTIKDSLDTADLPTTGGTKGREGFVPERDATVVARLREAGAILMGKTNTPEFTLSFETNNLIYGRTNNPWDLERTSGGSSGGGAALIAAGGTPFDIGSDFGGSIRLPSHFCGIAGIKPSFGRVPRTGHIYPFGGLLDDFQVLGPMARTVDDLILLLPLIAGPDNIDPGVVPMPLRDPASVDLSTLPVAFHTDNGVVTPTPETIDTVRRAASALEPAVASVEERRPDGVDQTLELASRLYRWDGGAAVQRLSRQAGTKESSLGADLGATPPSIPTAELDALIARMYDFRSSMLAIFDDADVVICPVNAEPAKLHGTASAWEDIAGFMYTMSYNITGWPGAVVRCGTSPEGLPIGVQILASPAREDIVLAVAKHLETELGGFVGPSL